MLELWLRYPLKKKKKKKKPWKVRALKNLNDQIFTLKNESRWMKWKGHVVRIMLNMWYKPSEYCCSMSCSNHSSVKSSDRSSNNSNSNNMHNMCNNNGNDHNKKNISNNNINGNISNNQINNNNTSDCNGTQTHNHSVYKRTLNHSANLASLAKWFSVPLGTKWLWVRVPLQSLKPQISRMFWARSSLTFRKL